MIGVSQLQFPSKDSSRLKFVSYFGAFVSLSIITNPVNVLFSLGTIFFRSEIKAFYIYKEIKAAKQGKIIKAGQEEITKAEQEEIITNKEYWEIFFKNNIIKLISFSLFSAFIIYLTFTTTFLLISLLGTIPLTMLLISLQSELRPKNFNPVTLFKAAINFFLEGIKENSRGLVNSFDVKLEHLLPHQLNDDIIENIDKLKDKYGEKIPEPKDIIENNEYKQFIEYIKSSYKCSDEDRGKVITFLNGFCSNDLEHSSGLTGGQILTLVLRACNDRNDKVVEDEEDKVARIKNKKDALIANLIDSQTFSRKERIPNICFTGNVYDMLISLQGIHTDPEIKFKPLRQMLLSEAQNEACNFIIEKLKEKKNNKEIFNAWYNFQNNPKDSNSREIVDDFIAEVSIPLMRELLSFSSGYTEQIVLTLMKNIGSIKLNRLEDFLLEHIRDKLEEHGLDKQEDLLENVKEKVFLKLLNKGLLSREFFVGIFSHDDAKNIANQIIKKEVKEFELKAAEKIKKVDSIETQVDATLQNLLTLPLSREKKCCIAYRELSSKCEGDKKKTMENILLKRLGITKKEMAQMLEDNDIFKLKLVLEGACKRSGESMGKMIEKVEKMINPPETLIGNLSVDNITAGQTH